jgi:hypothetical protein
MTFVFSLLSARYQPLTAPPVQIVIPASVFNCPSALFGKQHFSRIPISRHQKRREVWPGWQWGLLPSLTPRIHARAQAKHRLSVNLFNSALPLRTPYFHSHLTLIQDVHIPQSLILTPFSPRLRRIALLATLDTLIAYSSRST